MRIEILDFLYFCVHLFKHFIFSYIKLIIFDLKMAVHLGYFHILAKEKMIRIINNNFIQN